MIDWISDWAGSIIVAVIIGTIIEMILPNGNSKKYIKMVIGIYILFTIVSPVITKFTGNKFQISDAFSLDEYIDDAKNSVEIHNTLVEDNNQSIREIYISGIQDDLKAKLYSKGYEVNNIELDVSNDGNYTINNIKVELEKLKENNDKDNSDTDENTNDINVNKIEKVDKVKINSSNVINNISNNPNNKEEKLNNLSNGEIKNIKEYLSGVYEVDEDNITIN